MRNFFLNFVLFSLLFSCTDVQRNHEKKLSVIDFDKVFEVMPINGFETNSPQGIKPFKGDSTFFLRENPKYYGVLNLIKGKKTYTNLLQTVHADSTNLTNHFDESFFFAVKDCRGRKDAELFFLVLRSKNESIVYWGENDTLKTKAFPDSLNVLLNPLVEEEFESIQEEVDGGYCGYSLVGINSNNRSQAFIVQDAGDAHYSNDTSFTHLTISQFQKRQKIDRIIEILVELTKQNYHNWE